MGVTQHLNITEIEQNQNNRYITHNNAIEALAAASNAKLAKTTVGSDPVNLTDDECTRYVLYVAETGATGDFDFVFVGEIGVNDADRLFVFRNETDHTATVKSDGAGATVPVPPNSSCLIHQFHDDMVKLAESTGATSAPYDVGLFLPGQPDDNVECFVFTAVREVDFDDDFAGSTGFCGTNPASTAAFDILKNGSSIGSISISTTGVFTFSTTGGAVNLTVGDRLSLTTPSPQDASLSNVSIVFKGTRAL